jgi:hypothetical protein
MPSVIGFPNPVNEKESRVVAGVVAGVSLLALLSGWHWLLVPLAYGFLARALSRPRLSPLSQLSKRVVAPRLGAPALVAGPPKRFAQSMGAVVSVVAAVAGLALGWGIVAEVLLALMVFFATLESAFGLCVGCRVFAVLMRLGLIPRETCAACNDIRLRSAAG